jgi:hypothetical protein
MSGALTRYGAITGAGGGDARVQIGGKGRKNVLAITASYQNAVIAAPGAGFQGRLAIVEGQIDPLTTSNFIPAPPDFGVNSNLSQFGKILFDVRFSAVGPHVFFLPIAQQEGSPQSDEDSTVNVILCIGQDGAAGVYIPVLSVSGQTNFGGVLAGQTTFGGTPQ